MIDLYLNCDGSGIPQVPAYNAFVHCPSAAEKAAFEHAVGLGYITWHAFPFNAELELMDESLVSFGVRLTHRLDDRYHGGVRRDTLSQRDVPGMSRAALPVLASNG